MKLSGQNPAFFVIYNFWLFAFHKLIAELLFPPTGKKRILMRPASSITILPFCRSISSLGRLASKRSSCAGGRRGVPRRKRMTGGLSVCRKAKSALISIGRNNNSVLLYCKLKNFLIRCRLHTIIAHMYSVKTAGFQAGGNLRRKRIIYQKFHLRVRQRMVLHRGCSVL